MLSKREVLAAIDLRVDYLGSNSSVAEHGIILEAVNRYELCAEESLEQDEWWPFVHCMYGLQACLSTGADETEAMSCAEAESGVDDDLELAGTDSSALSSCTCTLEGAVDYCATEHTSTDLATLKSCEESDYASELYDASNAVAVKANSGVPLWVNVNGVSYSLSSNETDTSLAAWGTQVLSVTCQALEVEAGSSPALCADYLYPGE
jgi:hypothetical protein